jgi:hypothetical protein
MRVVGPALLLPLALVAQPALSQSPATPQRPAAEAAAPAARPADAQAIRQTAEHWLKTCLADWDAQTHMTRSQWTATCRRVSAEREQFFLSRGDIPSAPAGMTTRAPRRPGS